MNPLIFTTNIVIDMSLALDKILKPNIGDIYVEGCELYRC